MNGHLLRIAFGGLAPARIDALFARHGTAERVHTAIVSGRTSAGARVVDAVRVGAEERREELVSLGVEFVERGEPGYPARLAVYEGSPRWLFLRGGLSAAPAIGIVGTRTCTRYGLDLAHGYGAVAGDLGWSVVSGLARGIDAAGHRGALDAGGHCHAVLGSGIDVAYPRANAALYREILSEDGVISSESPPGVPPEPWRFPARNRIIAGLSDVLLVVEAGEKGGALITARIAIEYGVPVYAVPGDVDRVASVGTNRLIRDGAFPIFDPEDLATTLELLDGISGRPTTV